MYKARYCHNAVIIAVFRCFVSEQISFKLFYNIIATVRVSVDLSFLSSRQVFSSLQCFSFAVSAIIFNFLYESSQRETGGVFHWSAHHRRVCLSGL